MNRAILVFIAVAVLAIGCAQPAEAKPPTLRYGVDVSAGCGMIISDPRFAVAAQPQDGDPLLFDDIGDFLDYSKTHQPKLQAVWVHDYLSKEWVPAEKAWFVASPAIVTPMNAEIASFADEATARAQVAATQGKLLDWSAVRSR